MALLYNLSIASLNLHGFISSWSYLHDTVNDTDITFIQEHWLPPDKLCYLEKVSDKVTVFCKSAMEEKVKTGILVGRPFGGVGVFVKNTLSSLVSYLGCDNSGRCIGIKICGDNINALLFGCYFPVYENNDSYFSCVSDVMGFMQAIIDKHAGFHICVTGDFNFPCTIGHSGFEVFDTFAKHNSLVCCDDLNTSCCKYTYHHDTLGQYSFIDHVFTDNALRNGINEFRVVNDGDNLSDHTLIKFSISVPGLIKPCYKYVNPVVVDLRWDKGDIGLYYYLTGIMLPDFIPDKVKTCEDIELFYSRLVCGLKTAANLSIPTIPKNVLKHYWSANLDALKYESVRTHRAWLDNGKPRIGLLFDNMQQAKRKYKFAVKDAIEQYENRFSDELYNNLLNKDMPSFWKIWNVKNSDNKSVLSSCIDNLSDDLSIASCFKHKFSNVLNLNCNVLNTYAASDCNGSADLWHFSVEEVDRVLREKIKTGKAAGHDCLSPEHLLYSHPCLTLYLCKLFNLMLDKGYVPKDFGIGVIVPIIKDKNGDACSSDNYRAITISPIISKVFELCLLNKFGCFLDTNHLQFGFKKDVGCAHAIYTVQEVANHFCDEGSNAYIASVDASKAFDRILHSKLFEILRSRGLPECFIRVIKNWYSKLYSRVKWNGSMSSSFRINLGIRQGGVLSPVLFNVYVDELICRLHKSDLGCHIGDLYVGCLMYADDLILLSASIIELQAMLQICDVFALEFGISFNAQKTLCVALGKKRRLVACNLVLNNEPVQWADKFKYLGVTFVAGDCLCPDCSLPKCKFYGACNGILNNCSQQEPVKLQLLKSFCQPLLTYSLGALNIDKTMRNKLSVCWNDGYRKVFGFHRWESVKLAQFYCGDLPFDYVYDLCRLKFFLINVHKSCVVSRLFNILESKYCRLANLLLKYHIDIIPVSNDVLFSHVMHVFEASLGL